MINQVDFEGYLTRAWEYREQRYMRLANHRPGEDGQTSSDYITILIHSALDLDPRASRLAGWCEYTVASLAAISSNH